MVTESGTGGGALAAEASRRGIARKTTAQMMLASARLIGDWNIFKGHRAGNNDADGLHVRRWRGEATPARRFRSSGKEQPALRADRTASFIVNDEVSFAVHVIEQINTRRRCCNAGDLGHGNPFF